MFSKPTKGEVADGPRLSGVSSLIAEGVTVRGDLATSGDLHLDGSIEGDVKVGRLSIGETGWVTGAIEADAVEVHGCVRGTISARQVRLHATAHVDGDITHTELAIDAGAHFEGRSVVLAAAEAPDLSVAAE
jgi:cytoskeletal protein CcmA (bactofilin family)